MARTLHKLDRIQQLGLQPHPEGGYYAETFRSEMQISTARGVRSASTAIWFLLGTDDVSTFHRLAHEEHWCWHEGLPVTLHVIDEVGEYRTTTIGSFQEGYLPALVIPANVWFGASVVRREFSGSILRESEEVPAKNFSGSILPESEEVPAKNFSGSIFPESEDVPAKNFSGSILRESEEQPKNFSGRNLRESEGQSTNGNPVSERPDERVDFVGSTPQCDYTLITAVVAPGFDFQDFELASREFMLEKYPALRDVVARLTRP